MAKNDDDSPATNHFKENMPLLFEELQLSEITCCWYYDQIWKYSIQMSADPLIVALSLGRAAI